MKKVDPRLVVGAVLVLFGLGSAAFISDIFDRSSSISLSLNDEQEEQIPWELFKYSLFAVVAGSMSVLYKYFSDSLEKSKQELARFEAETQELRTEVIEIYTSFKSVRREIRCRGDYDEGKPLIIMKTDYFALMSKFNDMQHRIEALKWRLDLSWDFLGIDQCEVLRLIKIIDTYTSSIGEDEPLFNNLDDEKVLEIKSHARIFTFFQGNSKGSPVALGFFDPMQDIRNLLKTRAEKLKVKV
jgi:hypothetical protein